jgi:hypothetical protein
MITLTGGAIQNANHVGVPNGSIEFCLNVDATVIAAPGGFVSSEIPIIFQFDANGNLKPGAMIWSNAELNPQDAVGLGTFYLVTIYDENNCRISQARMMWMLNQPAGGSIDIGTMIAFLVIGV